MTDDGATRDLLLRAGARLFADRGFKQVTVREICRAAGANGAAINYHFGGKDGLYREVVQQAIVALRQATESATNEGRGLPAEERLRITIRTFLRLLLSPEGTTMHRLVQRETHDPTPALDALIEQGVRPRMDHLAAIVAEMMGVAATDPRVMRCVGSIQMQSVMYLPNSVARRLGYRFEATPEHIDEVADYITRFSVAGVRAMASPEQPSGTTPATAGAAG